VTLGRLRRDEHACRKDTIHRTASGIDVETKWIKENHLVARITMVPK